MGAGTFIMFGFFGAVIWFAVWICKMVHNHQKEMNKVYDEIEALEKKEYLGDNLSKEEKSILWDLRKKSSEQTARNATYNRYVTWSQLNQITDNSRK